MAEVRVDSGARAALSTADPAIWRRAGARYRRDGFVVLPRVFSASQIRKLRAETAAICRGERGGVRGAVNRPASESDDAVIRRYLCIHHPHKLSRTMRKAIAHADIVNTLGAAIGPNVKCMQSMLFVKGPGKPGQPWHQDEFFIPTRDRSLCGVWVALDDATVENGCLWVLPGSQAPGVIYPSRPLTDPRFDGSPVAYGFPGGAKRAKPVEVPAGGVVFFNGYMLHQSLPNTTADNFRRALVFHVMSAESLLPWDDEGRMPHTEDMRDIFMVRGKDPYAWKGTTEVLEPYLREANMLTPA
jgi:phytanoyl-CoA hydroxylase